MAAGGNERPEEHCYLVRYAKTGPARYISPHDVRRAWERVTRRARLPLAYSRGFSPKPRLSFGPPLPVGAEGLREYVVMALRTPVEPEEVQTRLEAAAVPGLPVAEVTPTTRRKVRPRWADYELELEDAPRDLSQRVARLLGAATLEVLRQGGSASTARDIRPGVLELQVQDDRRLAARLSLNPAGMVTPRDLASALGLSFGHVVRRDIELAPNR